MKKSDLRTAAIVVAVLFALKLGARYVPGLGAVA